MNIEGAFPTPIFDLGKYENNHLWIKREDLIPFSFGGNKARKAKFFFEEIEKGHFDSVVTYGSCSSNHCRVVANECCVRGLKCFIISPEEAYKSTFNSLMAEMFGAEICVVPVESVHETIETKIDELKTAGMKPYFIEGGGHGNIGTESYVQCYEEIKNYENKNDVHFDMIFLASGTGTTQAGLICGQLLDGDDRTIVGISVARKNPRGRNIVLDSMRLYLGNKHTEEELQRATIFVDDYTDGYGVENPNISALIKKVMRLYGIPLDMTYTGKAFFGMTEYIKDIKGKNILYIHTGGTPLFFDYLSGKSE